jgi:hypothetical protein
MDSEIKANSAQLELEVGHWAELGKNCIKETFKLHVS